MIGFDLGTQGFKVAQLKKRFGRFIVYGQNLVAFGPGVLSRDGVSQKEVLSRKIISASSEAKPHRIEEKKIMAALPESFIYTKSVVLPTPNPKEAKKTLQYTLQFEAAEIFPIAPEDVYIDYILTGLTKQSSTTLVVAAPKTIVDDFSELIHELGFELRSIETKALALARLFLNPKHKSAVVLCDIGASVTKLSIFHDSQLRLTVTTALGAIDLRKKIESVKRFSREITNIIDFYQTKYNQPNWQPEKIIISGGGAHVPDVDRKLSKVCGIIAEVGRPIVTIDGFDPQFAVSYGLALVDDIK